MSVMMLKGSKAQLKQNVKVIWDFELHVISSVGTGVGTVSSAGVILK